MGFIKQHKRVFSMLMAVILCFNTVSQALVTLAADGDGNQYWKVSSSLTVNGKTPTADEKGYITIPEGAKVSFAHRIEKKKGDVSLEDLYSDVEFKITLPKEINGLLTADGGSINWQELSIDSKNYYLFGADQETRPVGVLSDDGKSVTYTLSFTPEFISATLASKLLTTEAGTTFEFVTTKEVKIKETINEDSSVTIGFEEKTDPTAEIHKFLVGLYRKDESGILVQLTENLVMTPGDYVRFSLSVDKGMIIEAGDLVDIFSTDMYSFVSSEEEIKIKTSGLPTTIKTDEIWVNADPKDHLTSFLASDKNPTKPNNTYKYTCYTNKEKIDTTQATTSTNFVLWLKYDPKTSVSNLDLEMLNKLSQNIYLKNNGDIKDVPTYGTKQFVDPALVITPTTVHSGAKSSGAASATTAADFTGASRRAIGGENAYVQAENFEKMSVSKGDYVTYRIQLYYDANSAPARVNKLNVYLPKGLEMVTGIDDITDYRFYADSGENGADTYAPSDLGSSAHLIAGSPVTTITPAAGLSFGNPIVNALFERGYTHYQFDLTSVPSGNGKIVAGAEVVYFTVYVNTDLTDILADLETAGVSLNINTMTANELEQVYTYGMLTMAEIASESVYSRIDYTDYKGVSVKSGDIVIDDDAVNDENPFNDFFQYSLDSGYSNYLKTRSNYNNNYPHLLVEPVHRMTESDGEHDNRYNRSIFTHARSTSALGGYYYNINRDEDDHDVAMICSTYRTQESTLGKYIGATDDTWVETIKDDLKANTNNEVDATKVTTGGTVSAVGQIVPYTLSINSHGAENLTNLTLTDTLSAGMSFVKDKDGNPCVKIIEILQDDVNRLSGFDSNGNPVRLINYNALLDYRNVKEIDSIAFHGGTGVTTPTGLKEGNWDITLSEDGRVMTINFGDVGHATYEIYYLAQVDKVSPTYTNKAELKGSVTEDESAVAKYKTSGSYALGHGKSITATDFDNNQISYRLHISLSGNYAADTFTMEDVLETLGVSGNVSLVENSLTTTTGTGNDTNDLTVTATTDESDNLKGILITNKVALIDKSEYYVYFTVEYDSIPYGKVINNTFGETTTETDYPLNIQLEKVSSANSETKLSGAEFKLYYSYTDADNNVPVTYGYGTNAGNPVTLTTESGGIATTGMFVLDAKKATNDVWSLKLVETTAPANYDMPTNPVTNLTVTRNDDGYVWTTNSDTITVDNDTNMLKLVAENTPTITVITDATASFIASKTYYGNDGKKTPAADQFTFTATLTSDNGANVKNGNTALTGDNKVLTVKNAADGSVTFPTLTFTAEGTYNFTIVEADKTDGTIKYDDTVYIATVVVALNTNGDALEATVSYMDGKEPFGGAHFANYDLAPVTASFGASKEYLNTEDELNTLTGDEFSFTATITSQNGAKIKKGAATLTNDTVLTAKNAAGGKVAFDELTFTEAGVYTFEIAEVNGGDASIAYDTGKYTATVTVTLIEDTNTLTADVTYNYSESNSGEAPKFTNTDIPADATQAGLTASKQYLDTRGEEKTLAGDEFTFTATLTSQNGANVKNGENTLTDENIAMTVKNAAGGSVSFPTLVFSEEGTYTFEVKETAGTGSITYDSKVYTATVTVTLDTKTNKLVAAVTYDYNEQEPETAPVFVNHDKPSTPSGGSSPAKVNLTAKKTLDGVAPKDVEFSFELVSETGAVLETVKNKGGNVSFGTLSFEEADTFTYTIREVIETGTGYRYDKTIYTAEIVVTKSGSDYKATVTYFKDGEAHSGTPLFENETLEETTSLTVNKIWSANSGVELPSNVTVGLYQDGELIETVTLNANNQWTYTWDKLDAASKWTVDEIDVPVGFTKTITGNEVGYTITNTYREPSTSDDSVTASFEATKTLNGARPGASPFRFTLTNNRGNVIQTVRANPDGHVSFAALTFTQVGTYTFVIQELQGTTPIIKYDTATFRAVVTVTEQNGSLVAEVSYPDGAPTFNNTTIPTDTEEPITEIDEDGTPLGTWEPDGDEWVFIETPETPLIELPGTGVNRMALPLFIGGLVLMCLGVWMRRRKNGAEI